MPIQNKPRPVTQKEAINKQIHPNPALGIGNPNVTKNRAADVSVKNDTFKEVTISLEDVYKAIADYIKNTIKPVVVENGQQIQVPVEYAFGDRWNEVQKNGFLRDKEGRLLLPMIVIKRDTIAKNRTIGNKLDGNQVHLYQSFITQYTQKNQYDNFAVLTGRIPVKQHHLVPIPDYVTITYNVSILTNSQKHSDEIIQAFTFAENSYWGQTERFKFSATIDNFADAVEYSQGEDRSVRCNFNIVVNAYLLPDSINRNLASTKKVLSKAVLKFTTNIEDQIRPANLTPIADNVWIDSDGSYFVVNQNGDYFDLGQQMNVWIDNNGNYFIVDLNGNYFDVGEQLKLWIDNNGNSIVDSHNNNIRVD